MLEERHHQCELRRIAGFNKEERLEPHLHMFAEGRILIRAGQPWTAELRSEWLRFPFGKHDDQVDALTLYLGWLAETSRSAPPVILGIDCSEAKLARALAGHARPLSKGEHSMRPRFSRTRRGGGEVGWF